MREGPGSSASLDASAATGATPVVWLDDPAENDGLTGFEFPANGLKYEAIESAESSKLKGREGSVDN